MASTVMVTGKRMVVLFGTMLTGMGGWAYSEAMAVQAKAVAKTYEIVSDTKDFVSDTKEFCHDGVDDLVNDSGFWKKQADGWKIISDNGMEGRVKGVNDNVQLMPLHVFVIAEEFATMLSCIVYNDSSITIP
eukprot:CAMPEP_0201606840 /NCGR_PEP_ID=MMETSP0492-20130828/6165_1 /ASSEMBLY_ACC=CAM_ASM_000837 /TAXON_ID=420259 /ORGANISM="Thalassiosira gravida, Strain GMp14c1" /LENGTH=131 /DNA_ID=CAMNT_0048071333 /DNA_START=82 /DNA_END=478 /DNA_ORIENTATION=-